jgi:transglutaminase-like putative cysteine protease
VSTLVARLSAPVRYPHVRFDFISDILLVVLAWITAGTVAASAWVPGSGAIVGIALVGIVCALVMARLLPRGLTFWLLTEVSLAAVLFVTTAAHSNRVFNDFRVWILAIQHNLPLAILVAMAIGAWVLTAWTAYWVVRRGNVALGVAPLAVVMALEVIDDPNQHGLTVLVLAWLVVAGLVLMRSTVARISNRWGSAEGSELPARVGVQGTRTLLLLIVAAFILPPLTTVDLSTRYFSGSSQAADGRGQAPHRGQGGNAPFVQTGYSERVEPGGTIVRSLSQVMEVQTDFSRTVYWRGIDLYAVSNGAWEVGEAASTAANLGANQQAATDPYLSRRIVHATIKVLGAAQNTIFWPGDPIRVGIASQVRGDQVNSGGGLTPVGSVDGAYARNPVPVNFTYTVDASVSVATEAQLRTAGINYPASVIRLANRRTLGGAQVIDPRIKTLAEQVSAGQATVYDKVKAIQDYLRTTYKYQLAVSPPPRLGDPDAYFLFTSKVGYCEYFASSMGEMVRSLGIPVRLADGYGPGISEQTVPGERPQSAGSTRDLIRAADAHTWVEVFFPSYGWVPFEPTPDPVYPPLDRSGIDVPQVAPGAVTAPATAKPAVTPTGQRQGGAVQLGLGAAVLALVLLVVGGLAAALVARGPAQLRSPEAVWRRLGWLAARQGTPRRPTDTPIEFARRLGREIPSVAPAIADLGRAYSQWCYRRGGIAEADRMRAEAAWRTVRGAILRELIWPSQGAAVR